MKIKAIVPIKLNSKRLPLKNIMKIKGKPLVEWTVNTLSQLDEVDDVIVYCSDDIIKDYIESDYTFIKRSKVLDRDDKNIHDIFNHLIKDDDVHADYWILQHCTSPFIKVSTIRDMIVKVLLDDYPYDSAFAVTKYQKFGWFMGKPMNFNVGNIGFTQTTEPIYIETSGPYIFKEKHFLETGDRVSKNHYMKVIPFTEGIDIDDEEDFKLAKLIGES